MTATSKASKTTPPGRKRRHRRCRRPTNIWSRFSPRRQAREGGKGREDDAFKKVNGARGRRRHRSASGFKTFATTPFQPRADEMKKYYDCVQVQKYSLENITNP